jgi:hypothetical protein
VTRGVVVLALLGVAHAAQHPLALEIRVFDRGEEVTAETRITVHPAGTRDQPAAQSLNRSPPVMTVGPAIYDAQVIRERDGRVVSIRWAERLVVMPYPDESGHHLEVINFASGYGALQVRAPGSSNLPELRLFAAGNRTNEAAAPITGPGYVVFVVPAGRYDMQVGRGPGAKWHPEIEVPLDRTRLWLVPR